MRRQQHPTPQERKSRAPREARHPKKRARPGDEAIATGEGKRPEKKTPRSDVHPVYGAGSAAAGQEKIPRQLFKLCASWSPIAAASSSSDSMLAQFRFELRTAEAAITGARYG